MEHVFHTINWGAPVLPEIQNHNINDGHGAEKVFRVCFS